VAFGEAWAKLGDRLLGSVEKLVGFLTKDRRRFLPQREVIVGTYREEGIATDVRAEIVLGERIPPDVEIFLDRIQIGQPYCPDCSSQLEEVFVEHWVPGYSGWHYECRRCGTEIAIDGDELRRAAAGAVRRDYLRYWSRYEEEIQHLTGAKPGRFKLPE